MVQSLNVAVIGGGAGGLVVPLGLEGTGVHCDLFESGRELGGNVRTRVLEGHIVETGAEFVGKRKSYPTVWTLLDIVGCQPTAFNLSTQIINHNDDANKINVTLPPVLLTAENDGNCCSCLGFFSSGPQKGVRVDMHSLFNELFNTMQMGFVSQIAPELPSEENRTVTLKEACNAFIHREVRFIGTTAPRDLVEKRRNFIEHVLVPMIAASYGKKISEIGSFGCHAAFNYLNLGSQWYDIGEGWKSVLDGVVERCKDATFKTNSEVDEVVKVAQPDGTPLYMIRLANGQFVIDSETNQPKLYNEVVFATPLDVLRDKLLPNDDKNQALKQGLAGVTYYPTTVVYSRDTRYQSTTGSVARVDVYGDTAIFSVTKEWKFKDDIEKGLQPIVKTWCYPGFEPKNVIHSESFSHLNLDDGYRTAQIAIRLHQGKNGLHYSGAGASYNDSNNAACRAAIEAAYRIAKKYELLDSATYLKKFMDENDHLLPENTDQLLTFPESKDEVRSAAAMSA